jgi:alpha-beta hydrolase superfamily lysophospholipase
MVTQDAVKQESATSSDGTTIVFDRSGDGPPVVIIGAGPTDRSANAAVAELLSARFTVFNYDRRARGDSGDTAPFTVEREYDDLAAVIEAAGGSACLYGTSGGAAIALEAAARGLGATRLGLWEPPYHLDDEATRPPADYQAQLAAVVAAGRPGDAVELFFTAAVGMPAEFVAQLRQAPFWPALERLGPALVYDAAIMGDFRPPTQRLAKVKVPTLVLDGAATPWMSRTADAVARVIPDAQRRTLTGQPHNVDPAAIAPALIEFFAA